MSDAPLLSDNLVFASRKFTLRRVKSTQLATESYSVQVDSAAGRTSKSVSPKAVGR